MTSRVRRSLLGMTVLGGLASAAGGLALVRASGAEQPPVAAALPAAAPARAVLVTTVHFAPMAPTRTLSGTIRARTESELGFRVSGKILRRLVDAGAVVVPGQVLAVLDTTDYELQLHQAEADLQAARTGRDTAQSELSRVSSLRRQGWSTGSDFDRQRASADDAQGRADRSARAVELARNSLAYGVLRADAAGVITETMAEPGQVVTAGQTVLRLAQTGEREADVAVPETMVALARSGAAAVSLWAAPGDSWPARLRELSPTADPATRTFAARFSIPTAGPDVLLGMTATVTLREDTRPVALLPLSAVLDEGHGPTVWVVGDGGRLTQRPVTVARYGERDVLVTAGVTEGERVVALGVQKLDAGQLVRPLDRLPS